MTPNQSSDLQNALKTYLERIAQALDRGATAAERLAAAFEDAPELFRPLHEPVSSDPTPLADAIQAASHAASPAPGPAPGPLLSQAEFKTAVMAANDRLGWQAVQGAFASIDKAYRFIKDVRPEHYRAVLEKLS
jgi:cell division septation protein DedD